MWGGADEREAFPSSPGSVGQHCVGRHAWKTAARPSVTLRKALQPLCCKTHILPGVGPSPGFRDSLWCPVCQVIPGSHCAVESGSVEQAGPRAGPQPVTGHLTPQVKHTRSLGVQIIL